MDSSVIAHLANGGNLDPVKPYRVYCCDALGKDYERIVWAHFYTITDGCLEFIILERKEIELDTPQGPKVQKAIVTTHPEAIAAGFWRHVEKVIQSPGSDTAN